MPEAQTTGNVTMLPASATETTQPARQSQMVTNVIKALVEAQSKIAPPKKGRTAKVRTKTGDDYSYNYASLDDILAAIKEPLAAAGLCFTQDATTQPGSVSVMTTLLHVSGEWLRFGPFELPAGETPQAKGSALTYARRYALTSALGIATEDDDAASAGKPKTPRNDQASEAMMKRLHAVAKTKGVTHEGLRDWAGKNLGIESLVELTSSGAKTMLDSLAELPDVAVEPGVAEKDVGVEGAQESNVAGDGPSRSSTSEGTDASISTNPEDDEPATRELWSEARTVFGSLPKVIAAYREAVGVTGTVKQKDVTNGVLRELIDVAQAEAAS